MSFASDTRIKKGFEKKLRNGMRKEMRRHTKAVAKAIAVNGPAAAGLVAVDTAAIEAQLLAHYNRVGKVFSRQLTNRLPNPVSVTGLERAVIESNLATTYAARASSQAQLIARTTSTNVTKSVAAQLAAGDVLPTNAALGRNVGAQLTKRNFKRSKSISIVETQSSAETAKGVEAAVVIQNPADVTKQWVAVGDSVTRDAHLEADGQVVPVDTAFIVMGESLMYPGDSAGSPGNIINCRCSSVINESDVISGRST
jgi:uncharacterized protein with gpF-like domain